MWWDSRPRSATARRVRKALASTAGCAEEEPSAGTQSQGTVDFKMRPCQLHIDGGSAARFFYCAKATNADRDAGLDACKKLAAGMVSNTSGQQMTRRDEGDQVAPKGEQPGETTDYANEVVEMAMAHAIKNKAEAAYRRAQLLDKRRLFMEEWVTYLGLSSDSVA